MALLVKRSGDSCRLATRKLRFKSAPSSCASLTVIWHGVKRPIGITQGRRHPTPPRASKMDQQPVEVLQPPTFDSEQSLLQKAHSATRGDASVTDTLTGIHHDDFPHNSREIRNCRTRHRRFPKPPVWAFIILIIVTGVSFCPALLANKKPFDLVIIDDVQPDTDGVSFLGATGKVTEVTNIPR